MLFFLSYIENNSWILNLNLKVIGIINYFLYGVILNVSGSVVSWIVRVVYF